MASTLSFVEYVRDQVGGAGKVSFRKMFGEYAIYCDGKVVALVCDNQFFVKPTASGRAHLAHVVEAPPYPGSKPYLLVSGELDDPVLAAQLIRLTARELPEPKAKPAPKSKSTPGKSKARAESVAKPKAVTSKAKAASAAKPKRKRSKS
jgi:TfoX/Sxy family transcriptional regulator of competence genes